MTATEVIVNILNGNLDNDRDRIVDAIKQRDRTLRATASLISAASLSVGARVSLSGLTPKYLNGLTGVITSLANRRAVVKLDQPERAGKYAFMGTVNAPAGTVRII